MVPSKPSRKPVNVNTDQAGRVSASTSVPMPVKKSAQPFGSVDKSVYKRPSVGISPNTVPVHETSHGGGANPGAVSKASD